MLAAVPAAAPVPVATIPAGHRLVEGVATDGRTIWVSSPLEHAILAFRGSAQRAIALPAGMAYPLGIAWDRSRGWLWIAADCPAGTGFEPCDTAALVAIDRAGKLRASLRPGGPFHPGDVSVAGRAVFVSDSASGAVYRVGADGRSLAAVAAAIPKGSAQGSALDESGRNLIVADYGQGITRIDLASGERTQLLRASGRPVVGVDGLVRVGHDYFGIRNGTDPVALIRFRVKGNQIESASVIEGGVLADPTQVAVDGKRLLIVANAGWAVLDKPDGPARGPVPILALPIPRD